MKISTLDLFGHGAGYLFLNCFIFACFVLLLCFITILKVDFVSRVIDLYVASVNCRLSISTSNNISKFLERNIAGLWNLETNVNDTDSANDGEDLFATRSDLVQE